MTRDDFKQLRRIGRAVHIGIEAEGRLRECREYIAEHNLPIEQTKPIGVNANQLAELVGLQNECMAFISALDNPIDRAVMTDVFINGYTYEKAGDHVGYSAKQIGRIIDKITERDGK